MPFDPWLVLAALIVEATVGYPAWLQSRLPHPVVWIGGLIAGLERRWNDPETPERRRRELGVATVAILIVTMVVAGVLIESLPLPEIVAFAVVILAGSLGLAQRSLYDHVAAVARPLTAGSLPGAQTAVGMIVGRDTETMDEAEVATAALESLAESFNDGVVAPVFWFVVGGLPGLFAYKAVNTADSMIGHMEPRWRAFGWAAAKADDLMNWIPARIAGGLIALAAGKGWRTMLRDARKHASPNAGWTEAAMAGGLGVQLGGPVRYDGVVSQRPVFGEGRRPEAGDLKRGLGVYIRACGLLWLLLLVGGLMWPR
ncbi:adenosylcobinamide-phosphate synthase CbiB [Caulobacter mirabilis]|uniref:adenosylcobinamide-phosphate synthase CbiB n=1 Tax=Caulobacter mirabilis TaxID=69666 RepID=UPI001FE94A17|nr:adenosylcobinamide-phosphate synthase CbiB [Caulobacter mirabilis]